MLGGGLTLYVAHFLRGLLLDFDLFVVLSRWHLWDLTRDLEVEATLATVRMFLWVEIRSQLAVKQPASGIIFHDTFSSSHFGWSTTASLPAFLGSVYLQYSLGGIFG